MTLRNIRLCVFKLHPLSQGPGIDTEERIIADVLFGHRAIYKRQRVARRIRDDAVAGGGFGGWHLLRRWQHEVDKAHQSSDAYHLGTAGHKDGEELTLDDGFAQALAELGFGKFSFLEVQLHKPLVVLGDVLNEGIV